MTPDQFIAKWRGTTLNERSAAQEHFLDLCRLLEQPTTAEADPSGTWYAFEKGASKAGGCGAVRAGDDTGAAKGGGSRRRKLKVCTREGSPRRASGRRI